VRARHNAFWDSKVTYHRDVAKERRQLLAEARREKAEKKREAQKDARAAASTARFMRSLAAKDARKRAQKGKAEAKAAMAQVRAEKTADARREREEAQQEARDRAARKRADAQDRQLEKADRDKRWREEAKGNPAVSAVQYRLAQAVLDGTARSSTMTKKVAQEIVDKTPRKLRSEYMRKNPRSSLNDAAALSESWHGRPAERATDYNEAFRYRGALTDLGRLQEIAVLETDRKAMLIKFDAKTRLASSENGKQLYIVGGDQSLDLGALGIVGEEAEKDLIPIGEVHHIVYVTAKMHLGREDKKRGAYQHELGEESGVMPILMYDRLNKACGFAGGVYNIDPTDYDGKHSAGIRD
jgi:hypothetical protein